MPTLPDDRATPADPTRAPFDYTAVTPAAVRAGCEAAIADCETLLAAVARVPDGRRTFANTVLPLDAVRDRLTVAGGQYGFLAYVATDAELRETALAYEQQLATYATTIGFRTDLYAALRTYAAGAEAQALAAVEARLLERTLRDYRRNGLELPAQQQARVQALKERLVAIGVAFQRNIDEYDDALLLTREQLAGLPDSYIERLEQEQTAEGPRYRVSLAYPEYSPFMEAAESEPLRRELFLKNHRRAAAANLPLLAEALAARDEIATLLGYASWAHYAIETKMAKTPEAATAFLLDLERRLRVKAAADLEELAQSKRRHTADPRAQVELWDWRYYQQRVLKERYAVDTFAVAEYFPIESTLEGLFALYQRLFGLRFVPIEEARAWHPDVRLYRVADAADGRHLGHFYLDLHPRPDKYGHAAAFTLRSGRRLLGGGYQGAVSAIVANFTKPGPGSPSLLRHSEVETLFHEFGHVLHQVLTRAPYVRFAGTNVERDFVEAPSQLLEHWTWEPGVLAGITRHVRTGEPLPAALLERMVAAKQVASGLHYLRQLYFARVDLAYHGAGREQDSDAIAEALHGITGFPFPPDTHFQAGFGHLFGYDAGYYSYLWSQVFGDDMFTRFAAAEGEGKGEESVGQQYRRLILEAGGTRDGADLVRDFLGRDPTPEAFLRAIGLEA